jgi:putative endonuclease
MTDDVTRRYFEHKIESRPGFTQRHGIKILVWYEEHGSRETAFERERQLKKWNRKWTLRLIERSNPERRDIGRDFLPSPLFWIPATEVGCCRLRLKTCRNREHPISVRE